jgi:putative transposase
MPRTARVKSPYGIYHIMIRGISEISLFKSNEDKDEYLKLIRKYQTLFGYKVYAYCLMTTHAHFIVDSLGADISKFMKAINLSYSIYYNKRYKRHGHVFQDRFKSKLIKDDKYLLIASAYIHSNPKDIKKYTDRVERYRYSSLGIYLNIYSDSNSILDPNYVLHHFSNNIQKAREAYTGFIKKYAEYNDSNISSEIEFINDGSEYRSDRTVLVRNYTPESIISFVSSFVKIPFNINIKFNHKNSELRAVCVVIMRSLCDFTLKQIGTILGNITLSNVSRLCKKGLELISEDANYKSIIGELLISSAVA